MGTSAAQSTRYRYNPPPNFWGVPISILWERRARSRRMFRGSGTLSETFGWWVSALVEGTAYQYLQVERAAQALKM